MNQNKEAYHIPVLIKEIIDALQPSAHKKFLDVTFGGGGHSRALLESDPTIEVIGMDWDENALKEAEKLLEEFPDRFSIIWGNFGNLYKLSKKHALSEFDGILADFGTSQNQIRTRDGFSCYEDKPLDMRMSTAYFQTTAMHIINYASEKEMCEIFWKFGEERFAKQIVTKILIERIKQPILTTKQLANIVTLAVKNHDRKIHPATKIFQALRIFVNHELDNIESFLASSLSLLKKNGRLACVSFHSLEDSLVKNFFKKEEIKQTITIVKPNIITATEQELLQNPSARSAKLRVAKKI